MPWCDDCSHYWAPTAMTPDGACPTCGRLLATPPSAAGGDDPAAPAGAAPEAATDPTKVSLREMAGETKAPWHFKLLIVLVVAYLAWRVVQMVGWVLG